MKMRRKKKIGPKIPNGLTTEEVAVVDTVAEFRRRTERTQSEGVKKVEPISALLKMRTVGMYLYMILTLLASSSGQSVPLAA